jgi:quercetin dioxygenase-like cupin family protein
MPTLSGFGAFDKVAPERINDYITRRVIAGDQGMLCGWEIKRGGHAAAHSHPHEQIVWMIAGKMDFRIGDERRVMGAGDIAVIPGGVEHEGWFLEDTLVLDAFAPPRADFLAGGPPPYMQS